MAAAAPGIGSIVGTPLDDTSPKTATGLLETSRAQLTLPELLQGDTISLEDTITAATSHILKEGSLCFVTNDFSPQPKHLWVTVAGTNYQVPCSDNRTFYQLFQESVRTTLAAGYDQPINDRLPDSYFLPDSSSGPESLPTWPVLTRMTTYSRDSDKRDDTYRIEVVNPEAIGGSEDFEAGKEFFIGPAPIPPAPPLPSSAQPNG